MTKTSASVQRRESWLRAEKSSLLLRYGVVVLAVAVTLLIKLLLQPVVQEESPFLLFALAVLVSAWVGGLAPGLLATLLSAVVSDYYFLTPVHSFRVEGLGEGLRLFLFVIEGGLITLVIEALHSARLRSEASRLEAQESQEALSESEERFRMLVEGVKDYAIFMLDPDGRVATWNEGAERINGYAAQEILGCHFSVFYTEEDIERDHPDEELRAAAVDGCYDEEGFRVRKDGSRFWASVVITALRDEQGGLKGFSKVVRDITERREAEVRLRETETRYRTLVEQIPAMTYIEGLDEDGKVLIYASPQYKAMLGYPSEEGVSHRTYWTALVHPDDRDRVTAEDERTDKTLEPFKAEYRICSRDGRVVWVRDEAVLVRDDEGRPVFWQGVMFDVTEQKTTEAALRRSEELHRTVVEQAAENIFLVDAQTKRFVEVNDALHRSLGYTAEELKSMTLYDVVAHDKESVDQNIARSMQDSPYFIGERQYRRKDGSLVDAEVSVSSISHGGRKTLCIVAHDVTERKRAEEALRRSLNALLALYEAGQILSSSLEREEIGARLLEIMQRVSNIVAAVIYLPDDQGRPRAWRTVGPDSFLASVREESETARQRVLDTEAPQLFEPRQEEDGAERISGLILPLRVRDRMIGFVEIFGAETLAKNETVETLSSLANQAASALENARLYEELAERESQLQDLVRKLLTAQEEERRRVAYDIHDGLAQTAAAALQHLQAFARRHTPDSDSQENMLEEALELVRQTVREARQAIANLRPTALDDFGLSAAVRLQIASFRAQGWEVSYEDKLGNRRLPSETETALFRVAQEALTNVRKHAQASKVSVILERTGDNVRLMVRDDGRGFSTDRSRNKKTTNGNDAGERIGLSGMRERVAFLDGKLEIRSDPEVGTSILAEIPLPETGEVSHAG